MYPEKVTGDEGSVARLNRWNVDVQTPEGKITKTAQLAQILQGFALAAYKEAVDFDEKMQLGILSDTLTDSEIVFEIGQVTNIGQLEKLRKDAVTIKQMQALDSFAAD